MTFVIQRPDGVWFWKGGTKWTLDMTAARWFDSRVEAFDAAKRDLPPEDYPAIAWQIVERSRVIHPQPKPAKRATVKRRKARAESLVKKLARAACVVRDGSCRYGKDRGTFIDCRGESEWAHEGTHKRARTRGRAPAQRHTTFGSLMLCTFHHMKYDAGRLRILVGANGCDGPIDYAGDL